MVAIAASTIMSTTRSVCAFLKSTADMWHTSSLNRGWKTWRVVTMASICTGTSISINSRIMRDEMIYTSWPARPEDRDKDHRVYKFSIRSKRTSSSGSSARKSHPRLPAAKRWKTTTSTRWKPRTCRKKKHNCCLTLMENHWIKFCRFDAVPFCLALSLVWKYEQYS